MMGGLAVHTWHATLVDSHGEGTHMNHVKP